MGFSLDEIKEIFSMSAENAQQKLFAKKNELSAKVNKLNNNIAAIDTIVSASDRFYPKINDIFSMPFENDENVIGKWELCGRVVDVSDIFANAVVKTKEMNLILLNLEIIVSELKNKDFKEDFLLPSLLFFRWEEG